MVIYARMHVYDVRTLEVMNIYSIAFICLFIYLLIYIFLTTDTKVNKTTLKVTICYCDRTFLHTILLSFPR